MKEKRASNYGFWAALAAVALAGLLFYASLRLPGYAGGVAPLSALPEIERVRSSAPVSVDQAAEEAAELKAVVDPFSLRIPVAKAEKKTAEKAAAAYVPKLPALSLGGVWIYGNIKYALIGDDSVAEGEVVEGWKVKSIRSDQVVLAKNGQQKILKLEE